MCEILITRVDADAIIPEYKYRDDAGFDFHCVKEITIAPGAVQILSTGLAVAIPEGFELQIRLRSSAALHTPLIIPNAPATIDAGYRGELGIIVRNIGTAPYTVKKGERIAQGVLGKVYRAKFSATAHLPDSPRGSGGYGSTGKE